MKQLNEVTPTVIAASESPSQAPLYTLRSIAAAVLRLASEADGLIPHAVTHSHRHGISSYMGWFKKAPTQKEIVHRFDIDFEPERDEFIDYSSLSGDVCGTCMDEPAPACVPFDLYLTAHSVDENGESPDFCKLRVDAGLLQEIESLRGLCQAAGLDEVHRPTIAEEWGPEATVIDLRLGGGSLVVTPYAFWIECTPRYGARVQSDCLSVSWLREALSASNGDARYEGVDPAMVHS
ncbi:MAG: hypothetical protein E6Q76_05775 [Rhizobium sp.]|nr:MAG: hypothetical protein E6Q76_05775 [Rhizobium sp.]